MGTVKVGKASDLNDAYQRAAAVGYKDALFTGWGRWLFAWRVCLLGPEGNGRLVGIGRSGSGPISWRWPRSPSLAKFQPRSLDDNIGVFELLERLAVIEGGAEVVLKQYS